jgi:DNA-binding NarL/FixJ family response regulator
MAEDVHPVPFGHMGHMGHTGNVDQVDQTPPRPAERDTGGDVLTRREEEVLQLIADGCAPGEVAERLYISPRTVKNHLASAYSKLGARDRTDAVLRAVRQGIVRL